MQSHNKSSCLDGSKVQFYRVDTGSSFLTLSFSTMDQREDLKMLWVWKPTIPWKQWTLSIKQVFVIWLNAIEQPQAAVGSPFKLNSVVLGLINPFIYLFCNNCKKTFLTFLDKFTFKEQLKHKTNKRKQE